MRYHKISSEDTNQNNLFGDISRHNIKSWKGLHNIFELQSISILAILSTTRQETVSMPQCGLE